MPVLVTFDIQAPTSHELNRIRGAFPSLLIWSVLP